LENLVRRIGGRLVLTATDLVGHLACPHLTQLNRAVAEEHLDAPVREDPELEIVARRGQQHERAQLGRFLADGRTVVTIHGEAGTADGMRTLEAQTLDAMRGGADVIYQGGFFDGQWHGRADFLLRTDEPSGLGSWSYEVSDAKLARSLRVAALLQMCEYSNHVARLQGRWPSRVQAVLGDGRTESFPVQDVAAYHRTVRARLVQAAAGPVPVTYPDPVEHCEVCPWRDACVSRRRADDHLSLVAGLRRDQAQRLEEAGIATVADLSERCPSVVGIQPATVQRLHAQAALQVRQRSDGRIHYELLPADSEGRGLRALPPPSPGDVFFDIEGDPYVGERGLQYLFGVTEVVDGRPEFHAIWGHDPAGERRGFEAVIDMFTDRLAEDPGMHIYHYAAYEPTAVRRLAGEHGTREEAVDQLLRAGAFVDLYEVMRQGMRFSTESYSLKSIEPMFMPERSGPIIDAGSSIVAYERWLEDGNPARLEEIAEYNRADCESTWRLRGWLEGRRDEYETREGVELDRPAPRSGVQSEAAQRVSFETVVLATALTADVPDDLDARTEEQEARRLLASLLDWHRREARPEWGEYFARARMTAEELYEDGDAIAGLRFVGQVGIDKQSVIHRYAFDPRQEFTIGVGDAPVDPSTGQSTGTVFDVDNQSGTIDLRRGRKRQLLPHPEELLPGEPYGTAELRDALRRLARWVADHGIDEAGPYRAGRDLLLRRPPRVGGVAGERPLRGEGESTLTDACRVALDLDGGCLPIQGPPGTGKTLTAAHIAIALVRAGRRVGITAMSHKAIGNLLDRICTLAREQQQRIVPVQKADSAQRCATRWVRCFSEPGDVVQLLGAERVDVVAGTAWLFARSDMAGSVDTLIVDEAGQLSLANVMAICGAARNVILCGDPQQLSQPSKGSHPDGADHSALEHVLGGSKTIADDRGIFLDTTWRMHPAVCSFISEAFYEGRLTSDASCARQSVTAGSPSLSGAGLRHAAVLHRGNRVASVEEAARVRDIFEQVVGGEWVDREGHHRQIGEDDVLVVAPYNAHVRRLRDLLPPGARVGTVDRFQGQEAPVVIYSMATSSPDDQRRAMDFLYSLNRFNVALSRAQVLVVLVNSPDLLYARCRSPREVVQANTLCRFVELATPLTQNAMP
jgi:predicted RecB family nuclease